MLAAGPGARAAAGGRPYGANPNSSDFSTERAEIFAYFSHAAYCDAPGIRDWTCGPCLQADPTFKPSLVFQNKSMQVIVGSNKGNVVVAFRGTSNLQDFLIDINFPKTREYPKCTGCLVHEGFYNSWLSVRDPVIAEAQRLVKLEPTAKVFVTGHSLGAALAALCAADLGANTNSYGIPIEGVYTYGQPRVGNEDFAKFYSNGTRVSWRLTHWRDLVPHLPPQDKFVGIFNFKHSGTEVFYNEDASVRTLCDGTGEDEKCSDQFGFFESLSISDHLEYLNISIAGSC